MEMSNIVKGNCSFEDGVDERKHPWQIYNDQ